MILTLTLNPAYDVTYELPEVRLGHVQRVRRVRRRPGGKGINVAAVLHQCGEPVTALGLSDADFARAVEAELDVATRMVHGLTRVRSTLVLRAAESTSLWEPGEPVDPAVAESLIDLVAAAVAEARVLVISGSLAPGLDAGLPATITQVALAAGVVVIADLDGEALRHVVDVGGAIVMPNEDELAGLLGVMTGTLGDAVAELAQRTGAAVVHTRGESGLIVADGRSTWSVTVDRVEGNATGAGDATAAGLARALTHGVGWPDCAVDAAALGAAAVACAVAGEFDPPTFERIRATASVEQLTGARSAPTKESS